MNTNAFTTSLACAALVLLSSSWNGNYGVDAWVSFNDVVTCLADAPTICTGSSFGQGPSPAYDEATNTTTDIGGWKFTYDFMDGLETYNGTAFGDIMDDGVLAEANATTLEVSVTIDDDGSCVIDVGSETCSSCSTDLCGFDDIATDDLPLSVTFDCTNVVNGRASLPEVCESLPYLWYEGVFYPLMYTTTSSMDKEETDTNVEGLTVADTVDTPAADGNYQPDPLPANEAQLCVTNAFGATCPSGGPSGIACCTSSDTGGFFNACCPTDFTGINMGTGATDANEFEMMILNGSGVATSAVCVVNSNQQGCIEFNVPGNEASDSQPLILPAGVDGPCVEMESGTSCSMNQGTCNTSMDGTSGRSFDVCCPNCATGTYLPGQSCAVTLPDPGACGYNSDGSNASMSKEDDNDASALDGLVVDGGSTSTSTSTSTSSNGDASSSTTSTSTSTTSTSSSTTASTSTSTSTCGLLPAGTFPQDGMACSAAMPAGQTTIWCEMSRSFTTDAVDSTMTEMDKSCTCDLSNPTWKCSTSTHDSSSSMSKEDDNDESAAVDVLVVDDGSSSNADASSTSSSLTTTTSTTSTCGLLPAGTLPQKDADCSAALPEGTSTIWCEDLSFTGAGDTQTDTSCTCDRSNPIWKCTATDAALAPNQPCPPADKPKASGNSCVGQLSQPNSSMTCTWSRSQPVSSTSDAMEVSTISCECKRDADGILEESEFWVCDGTFPPIPSVSASKENNDKDVDSIADVGTVAAATTASSGNSAAVHYVAVMAVGVVGAVFTMTTL